MSKYKVIRKARLQEKLAEAVQEGITKGRALADAKLREQTAFTEDEMAALLFLLARGDIKVALKDPNSASAPYVATSQVSVPRGFIGLCTLHREYDKTTDCWTFSAKMGH